MRASLCAVRVIVCTHGHARLHERLRQREVRRLAAGSRASKPWKLCVSRDALLDDVLEAFAPLATAKKRHLLFAPPLVTFRSSFGEIEDGDDRGGLTAEMYSLFWSAALRPEAGLFEGGAGLLLPTVHAPAAALEAVGALLCKCIIDEHPVGRGLCTFVYDYLVSGEGAYSLRDPTSALSALRDFDPMLADSWGGLLDAPSQLDAMASSAATCVTLDAFDDADADGAHILVTSANIADAVMAGCRWRLLESRRTSFEALVRGFTTAEDLQVQLGPFHLDTLTGMLQGKASLSINE